MSSRYLHIKSKTWDRDSHGLFDYDTTQLTESILKVTGSGSLVRKGNEIIFSRDNSSPTSGLLLKVFETDDSYIICPGKQEPISLVIQMTKQFYKKGFKLSTGDFIKIGRIKLRVKKIFNDDQEKESHGDEFEGSNNGDLNCRFCFTTHSNKYDPLLSICKCAGSMELVHIQCLRQYIMSKAIKKENLQCTSYCWKNFQCDVCKEDLPLTIKFDEKLYEVIPSLCEAGEKYMILEDFRRRKYKYILHVLKFGDIPLMIGRSSETDIKLNDISVSRLHAYIEISNDQFYLKDNNSKFGTLIVQKKPLVVSKQFSPTLQIGRSIVAFTLKNRTHFLNFFTSCCKKYNKVEMVPKARTEVIWEAESFNSPENANNSI